MIHFDLSQSVLLSVGRVSADDMEHRVLEIEFCRVEYSSPKSTELVILVRDSSHHMEIKGELREVLNLFVLLLLDFEEQDSIGLFRVVHFATDFRFNVLEDVDFKRPCEVNVLRLCSVTTSVSHIDKISFLLFAE